MWRQIRDNDRYETYVGDKAEVHSHWFGTEADQMVATWSYIRDLGGGVIECLALLSESSLRFLRVNVRILRGAVLLELALVKVPGFALLVELQETLGVLKVLLSHSDLASSNVALGDLEVEDAKRARIGRVRGNATRKSIASGQCDVVEGEETNSASIKQLRPKSRDREEEESAGEALKRSVLTIKNSMAFTERWMHCSGAENIDGYHGNGG
ncbi:hypothetical protein B0H13DRAFT_1855930 [Mycena leptocephala]|nr:hypothetical protein B0H13DRAFT_1855930 [Mycena leptocephala]